MPNVTMSAAAYNPTFELVTPHSDILTVVRTNSSDPAFRSLVAELDRDLAIRDGDDHSFFAQFNKLHDIKHVVLAQRGDEAVGCGAFKPYSEDTVEIKRMYVPPKQRQQGIASLVLAELERWAGELGYRRCVLETGLAQPEAIGLYRRNGYHVIPNYGQYMGVESSVCFQKDHGGVPVSDRP